MNARGLTILAVDDERTQLDDLARMLRGSPLVDEVECAFDGREALMKASDERFDVIFLDVRMPELDGVALARVLRRFSDAPQLVFVSAYDTAAADAFELHAADYLRKPVSRRRLEEALERVTAGAEDVGDHPHSNAAAARDIDGTGHEPDVIAVANLRGGGTRLLSRNSILYAEAHGDYARIVAEDGRYLLRATLTELERRWEPAGFARVHRRYLANLHRAVEIRPELGGAATLVFADGQSIQIARRHAAELRRRVGL